MTTAELDFDNFTLTGDQQRALDAFQLFLLDPSEQVFVLSGFSGCGKTTLVRTLIDRLPAIQRTAKLIDPTRKPFEIKLTATTNKAAENLAMITGMEAGTVQSFLGLRVQTDYKTNVTTLVPRSNFTFPEEQIVFIDEASYVDKDLLGQVFSRTRRCKIVFVGDPAQLTPVKSRGTPVFDAGFTGAALTEVVRQPKKEGGFQEIHPITAWAEQLRNTVKTGDWTPFKPDEFHIQRLDRAAFSAAIEEEFTRTDWRYTDSKILGWTNKCVIAYNQYVRNLAKGDPHFQVGDYAVNNSFVMLAGGKTIKTDALVQIAQIEPDTEVYDVPGNWITVDGTYRSFQPKSLAEKNTAIRLARNANELNKVQEMEDRWFDLRGAPAQTINKSQGSTYDKVFIDLDDISRCHDGEQVARMLYVGASRARHHVYLVGDLT